ncbi:hypothetical protein [Bacillus sp. NPDC094106]|uniref:hypothetical protein n=1 Tax=Bacillus sp. NPDC094106 TaxID=3363949 RepID=UPI00380E0DB7
MDEVTLELENRRKYQRNYKRKRRLDPEYRAKERQCNKLYRERNKDKAKQRQQRFYKGQEERENI